MEYTFVSEPNMVVREHKRKPFVGGFKYITIAQFDADGRLTTDNPALIAKLSPHFRAEAASDEVSQESEGEAFAAEATPEQKQDETVAGSLHCKKCDFTCGNKGVLMHHYRTAHSNKEA